MSSDSTMAWTGFSLVVTSILVFLQVHFLARRIEEVSTWSWGATLVPLWILNGLIALYLVAQVLFGHSLSTDSDDEYAEARDSKISHFSALIVLSMFFATEVMIAQRLDGTIERTMFAIFGPLYAVAGFIFLFGGSLVWFNRSQEPYSMHV